VKTAGSILTTVSKNFKVLIVGTHKRKKKKKDLDNFQGFKIFGKKNSQWFSVLQVLIKITTLNFQ
jgi:hypothetical protein